jgi:alpha-beta hydrolase superfamily lysophospholipase
LKVCRFECRTIHSRDVANYMKKTSILKKITLILLVLGLIFLHFYIPRFITEIKNPVIEIIRSKSLSKSETTPLNKNQEILTFRSFDNTKLTSLVTYSKLDTSYGTIILLHGIRSNKESFNRLSGKLSQIGYNCVAIDSRAHGQSGGQFCTFGVKEKLDISRLIDTLIQTGKFDDQIGVWGQSLGGAIGLQAISIDKRIKYGIIESAFSDFEVITQDYFEFHLGFNIPAITNYLTYRAGKISDFEPNEARPVDYCKNIDQPILIVHGSKDKRINIKYALENFESIISTGKEFLEIQNANHLNVWEVGNDNYFEKAFEFIKRIKVGNNGYKSCGE